VNLASAKLSVRQALVILEDAAMNGRLAVDRDRGMVRLGVPGLLVSARIVQGALVQIDALDACGVLQTLRPGGLEFPAAAGEIDGCLRVAGEPPLIETMGAVR
jgi:hypothetical protein